MTLHGNQREEETRLPLTFPNNRVYFLLKKVTSHRHDPLVKWCNRFADK